MLVHATCAIAVPGYRMVTTCDTGHAGERYNISVKLNAHNFQASKAFHDKVRNNMSTFVSMRLMAEVLCISFHSLHT